MASYSSCLSPSSELTKVHKFHWLYAATNQTVHLRITNRSCAVAVVEKPMPRLRQRVFNDIWASKLSINRDHIKPIKSADPSPYSIVHPPLDSIASIRRATVIQFSHRVYLQTDIELYTHTQWVTYCLLTVVMYTVAVNFVNILLTDICWVSTCLNVFICLSPMPPT